MNWYIGQDIVAITDHSHFKKGDTFVIRGLQSAQCSCGITEIDVGLRTFSDYINCSFCNTCLPMTSNIGWVHASRFAPLDSLVDISELIEHLENTKPFEV